MGKKRAGTATKAQAEEKKPKIVVKNEPSEEEEEESEAEEEETQEVEVTDSEEEVEEEEEEVEEEEGEEENEDDEEDEDDESSKKESLRKLLEPLPKEKIIEILKEAALNDRSIVASLTQTAEVDPAHRKIFVFGLGWDATSDQVLSVFKQYGEIEDCKVVTDKVTGKAKGYGFVLFKTRKSAQKSLEQTQKKIGSRMASCQLAAAGKPGAPGNTQTTATPDPAGRKIFVANVLSHVDPNALRVFFAKFGEIEEGPLGLDNVTGKFKGFAIFIYKTVDGCKKALEEPNKAFDGCKLQCRQAVDNQRGNKAVKSTPPVTNNNETGNAGYGNYGGLYAPQIVNPAAGLMVGANPMLMSALNQNSVSSTAQPFGLGGGYGINTVGSNMLANYGSQLGLPGLGGYQTPQVGRSSTDTSAVAGRQQSGIGSLAPNFPSYLGR
ncbi:UBP1-associated protein 2B-like [Bidens hawaiensis]|uniref:UBP1-associated protein 2B-like n=1 Tax=Bidens hawaiensis TaxID=980011 RepID=UPI004049D51F